MIDDYQNVQAVDLLKDENEREVRLTKTYYRLFYESDFRKQGTLKFLHFDFYRFTKGDHFQQIKVMIGQLNPSIQQYGHFQMDINKEEVL